MGARNPPRFPPVFSIPAAAPTCSLAISIAAAQNGPSHHETNPVANDIDSTAAAVPDAIVPANKRTAPALSPASGIARRPNLAPYDRVSRSDNHPPRGIMIPCVTKTRVVYLAL